MREEAYALSVLRFFMLMGMEADISGGLESSSELWINTGSQLEGT